MKKAVILIHGYATDKTDFAPLIPYLEGIYDYVCARNIQGHGLDTKDHLLNFNAIDTIKNERYKFYIYRNKNYHTYPKTGIKIF